MRVFALVIALFVAVGCTSIQEHRRQYVEANPDMADYKKEAMLIGKAVPGMTVREVELSINQGLRYVSQDSAHYTTYRTGSGRTLLFFRQGQLDYWKKW